MTTTKIWIILIALLVLLGGCYYSISSFQNHMTNKKDREREKITNTAFEKANIERSDVTDKYVLSYLDCTAGLFSESDATCLNSVLGLIDQSNLNEKYKGKLKTGLQHIVFGN